MRIMITGRKTTTAPTPGMIPSVSRLVSSPGGSWAAAEGCQAVVDLQEDLLGQVLGFGGVDVLLEVGAHPRGILGMERLERGGWRRSLGHRDRPFARSHFTGTNMETRLW